MNPAFRSHLMQQFAAAAVRQSRPPLVLARISRAGGGSSGGTASASGATAGPAPPTRQRRPRTPPPASSASAAGDRPPSIAAAASPRSLSEVDSAAGASEAATTTTVGASADWDARPAEPAAAFAAAFRSLLLTRRTVSNFDAPASLRASDRVRDALTWAVECAAAAPNHRRTEPVTFRRMMSPSDATDRLADIAYRVNARRMRENARGSEASIRAEAERKRERWRNIPAFLVATVSGQPPQKGRADETDADDDDDDDERYAELPLIPPVTERQLEDYACAAASVQNALLSLHAEGLASKWATGPVIRTWAFRELVGCGDDDAVVALVMVGIPKGGGGGRAPRKPRRRRELMGDVLRDL